jgi:hypothetical protein
MHDDRIPTATARDCNRGATNKEARPLHLTGTASKSAVRYLRKRDQIIGLMARQRWRDVQVSRFAVRSCMAQLGGRWQFTTVRTETVEHCLLWSGM